MTVDTPTYADLLKVKKILDAKPIPDDVKMYVFGEDTIEIFPNNLPADHPFRRGKN